jgi:hypothetical protein
MTRRAGVPRPRPVRGATGLLAVGVLAACGAADLDAPPVPLGDFALGLNVAVADNAQRVPISREATAEEWEAAMEAAVEERFGRYDGTRLFNIGISIDGYALAPPGIPVVAAPVSVLVVTANVWEDATQTRLNAEGKQLTVFEDISGETVIGTGLTRTKDEQMAALSQSAARAVEQWFLQNPGWFGISAAAPVVAAPVEAAP